MLERIAVEPLPDLQHDAAIIDERPDHWVLAVKIRKETIKDHAELLAYLFDSASGSAKPLRLPIGKRINSTNWTLKLFAGVVTGLCLAMSGFFFVSSGEAAPEPPLITSSIRIANPVVGAGEALEIAFETHRKRLCRTDIERTILDATGTTVFSTRQHGIGQAVSDAPIARRTLVKLPDGLKSGDYTYRSITYSDCGPNDQHAHATDNLPFEVRRSE